MADFTGKIVAITGASAGVGRTAAILFAKQGAKVVGIARRQSLLDELKKEITDLGGEFTGIAGDVTSEEDINKFIDTAINTYGGLDILVNCAGTTDRLYMAHNTSNEMWDRIINLNLRSVFLSTRKALSYMLPNGKGNIVNIGSVASIRGMIGGASYTASKHAVMGLTKSVAYCYAKQGIRCNMIMPGGVNTFLCSPEIAKENEPEGFAMSNSICAGMIRLAEPEEIANVIMYLASDESGVLNGAAISADAGFMAS